MKKYINYLCLFFVTMLVITACEKKGFIYDKPDALPDYSAAGIVNTITASASTVAGSTATDATTVETFTWTSPNFSIDTSTIKYVVLIDSTGRNFSKASSYTITGTRSLSFTGQALNNLLIAWGVRFGTAATLDVKVISAYPNNNNAVQSNTIKVTATPYSYPITLAASPSTPFAPTSATSGSVLTTLSWNQTTYLAATITYSYQYDSTGKNFANAKTVAVGTSVSSDVTGLQLNTYALNSGIAIGVLGSVDFRVVATLSTGQVVYSATKTLAITPGAFYNYLYISGVDDNWDQPFTRSIAQYISGTYEGYLYVTKCSWNWQFRPFINTWDFYGFVTVSGLSGSLSGLNTPASDHNPDFPVMPGYYYFTADLTAKTYSITQITTWGVIGDATPGGWTASTPLTYNSTTKLWTVSVNFSGSGGWKFRANNDWVINLGAGSGSYLSNNGGNINSPAAGVHTVTLDLSNPQKYTYTIQ